MSASVRAFAHSLASSLVLAWLLVSLMLLFWIVRRQTGSGKTFTTFGPGAVMENHLNPSDPKSYALRGLVPRVLEYLYASIATQVANGNGRVRLFYTVEMCRGFR